MHQILNFYSKLYKSILSIPLDLNIRDESIGSGPSENKNGTRTLKTYDRSLFVLKLRKFSFFKVRTHSKPALILKKFL